MPQTRILFVLEYYYPHIGGVETLFHQLVTALQQSGVTCTILTQRFSPALAAKERTPAGTTIRRLAVPNRYLFTLVAFLMGFSYFRKTDLIHTTSYNAAIPAFLGGLFFRKPVLITFHEAWGKLWFQLPFMSRLAASGHYAFEQVLFRLPFRYFIGVSQATSQRLLEEGVPPKRIKTIYNGLNYSAFHNHPHHQPAPVSAFQMTYFGRIGLSKGLDLLLPAFAHLVKTYPHGHLQLIVPEKPTKMVTWLRKTITRLGIENHTTVFFSLPQKDLQEKLRASNWVVIPSYSEGFCFAAAEAVAMGIPIVHSGQGALPEVVSGYFVEANSHETDDLLEALLQAAAGDWSYRPFRPFPLTDSVAQYMSLYQDTLPTHLSTNEQRV